MSLAVVAEEGNGLAYYERAQQALALAKEADEVRHIIGFSDAMRAAAKIARNRQMEIDAAEIRIRGTRRLGEMLAAHKGEGGLQPGPKPINSNGESIMPTLQEIGIDPKLSMTAQRLANVPEDRFQEKIVHWRRTCEDGKSRVTISLYHGDDAPPGPHRPLAGKEYGPPRPPAGEWPECYEELIYVLAQERRLQGISQVTLDEIIGWTEAQTSHYETPHDSQSGRTHSWRSIFEHLKGLGKHIEIVDNEPYRKAGA